MVDLFRLPTYSIEYTLCVIFPHRPFIDDQRISNSYLWWRSSKLVGVFDVTGQGIVHVGQVEELIDSLVHFRSIESLLRHAGYVGASLVLMFDVNPSLAWLYPLANEATNHYRTVKMTSWNQVHQVFNLPIEFWSIGPACPLLWLIPDIAEGCRVWLFTNVEPPLIPF